MAESLKDIAKRLNHPERGYFEYFANRSDSQYASGKIADQTRLAQIAFDALCRFGLAGVRGSDQAFELAIGKLPRSKYNVFMTASDVDKMSRALDSIPRQLDQTIKEQELAIRDLDRGAYKSNASVSDLKKHVDDLKARKGRFRTYQDQFRTYNLVPADPRDSTKWLRD